MAARMSLEGHTNTAPESRFTEKPLDVCQPYVVFLSSSSRAIMMTIVWDKWLNNHGNIHKEMNEFMMCA
jgi:hypothetical protein